MQRCAACGSAYLDPRPSEATIGLAYERYFGSNRSLGMPGGFRLKVINGHLNVALGYDLEPSSALGRLVPFFPKRRWRAEWSVRHLPKQGTLLDVGCGTGEFLERMRDAGWKVRGIEPDPTSVDVARSRGLDVQQAGLAEAQLEEASFDAITMNHVIEHLHEPGRAIERSLELLRPGGSLWVATPNIDALGHERFGPNWFGLDPPRHLVLFTADALEGLLRRAGFAEVRRIRAYRADLTYSASAALERGEDPLEPTGTPAAARLADLRAFLQPSRVEELTVLATAP